MTDFLFLAGLFLIAAVVVIGFTEGWDYFKDPRNAEQLKKLFRSSQFVAIGVVLIVLGVVPFFKPFYGSLFLGTVFIITGFQIILWVFGFRSYLLGNKGIQD